MFDCCGKCEYYTPEAKYKKSFFKRKAIMVEEDFGACRKLGKDILIYKDKTDWCPNFEQNEEKY